MSNFGFGLPDEQPPGGAGGSGGPGGPGDGSPFGFGPGGFDPNDIGAAFARLGQMMSWTGGPVNWDLARDTARAQISAAGDASVGTLARREVLDALRLAEVWLDGATTLPAGAASSVAWSRSEWVEGTLAVWKQLVDPVAARVVEALGGTVEQALGQMGPEGLSGMPGLGAGLGAGGMAGMADQLGGVLRAMGGAMFGQQLGTALGTLAGEVVGSTDVGLPLGPTGRSVLVPANVAAFGQGLGVPEDEVRLFLALREAAHQRLFAHVPWLRAHLLSTVDAYARGISIDTSRLEQAVGQIDPTDPQAFAQAIEGGLFEPEDTPEQTAALARLGTALALVEGWVDEVVHEAASAYLPSADRLRETLRRRRAGGGPAEQTFATLVGLELRPRRLREAATLWQMLRAERGTEGRDAVWAHPDLMPGAADLDDPTAFVSGASGDDDLGAFSSFDVSDLEALSDADAPREGDDGTVTRPTDGPDEGPAATDPTDGPQAPGPRSGS